MAYIGAQPNKQLTKTTSQSFNGTGSATAFTLNRAVNTGEELEVFVDNVQQEPGSGKSYTATGTTLTFDEAPPSGTGNVYVIYRGQAEVTTRLEASDLSITTAKLAADAVTTAKIADDAVTSDKLAHDLTVQTSLSVPTIKDSSGTNTAMTIDSTGRIFTPARPVFHVSQDSSSTSAYTGAINFNTVHTNVGSHFDISNDRFVVPIAGIYHFDFSALGCNSGGGQLAAASAVKVQLERSTDTGSNYTVFNFSYAYVASSTSYPSMACSGTIALTAGDYIRVNVAAGHLYGDGTGVYDIRFSGFLVG